MILSYSEYRIIDSFSNHRGIHGIHGGSLPTPISPSKDVLEQAQHIPPKVDTIEELIEWGEHFKILVTTRNSKIFISAYQWNPKIEMRIFTKFQAAKDYLTKLLEDNIK